jgi:hypothetical protein
MTMSTNDGDKPAFPCRWPNEDLNGMSLLDYFAGQALAGLSRNYTYVSGRIPDEAADLCWELARAIIRRRPQ